MCLETLSLLLCAISVMWWQHDDIKVGGCHARRNVSRRSKKGKMNVSKVKKKFKKKKKKKTHLAHCVLSPCCPCCCHRHFHSDSAIWGFVAIHCHSINVASNSRY